jgi:flagellin
VDDINNNNPHVGWHAAVANGHVAIISDDATPGAATSTITIGGTAGVLTNLGLAAGTSSGNDTVVSYLNIASGAGTAGNGPAVATYLHLQAGTTGVAGNDQMLVSSDLSGPKLVTIAAGTYGDNTGTTIQRAVNNALVSAGLLDSATTPTSGVAATLNGTGNLVLTSTTVGTASAVSIAAAPTVYGTLSSALGGGGIGLSAGAHTGGSATAASLATQIQSAIDTATGTGSTNAHATVTVDATNHIIITNDTKGAAHSVSAFSLNASSGFFGTGAAGAVAGTDRSGTDIAAYLNQQFSSDTTLAPASLKATWDKGGTPANTLTIESANNTNFRINSGSTGSGVVTGTNDLSAGHNWSGANEQRVAIKVDGVVSSDIVLTANAGSGAAVLTEVNRAMTAAGVTGVTASLNGSNHLVFTSNTTSGSSNIQLMPAAGGTSALTTFGMGTKQAAADANLGYSVSGSTFASGLTATASTQHIIDAGGASSATAQSFSAMKFGNDAQAVTISANDANGNQQSLTVTLKNLSTGAASDNRAGRNIDESIAYINQQLQASNNATLKKIVAVKENVSGDKINFVSSLSNFNVSVSNTANADGINAGVSKNITANVVGAGANMAVDTETNAMAAVTAIAAAIAKLGSAQAAVGKGQNQLSYAVNLAQSQITNFSSAESQIRDANVAQQAANLSKAQVLTQASIAAMAQANSAPQAVLSLLRG